jgi:uracil phosphoribosyltransferase
MPLVSSVTVARHPLVRDKLARLRDRDTPPPEFRALVRDLSRLLFYEAMADAALEAVTVRTPLAECAGERLADRIGLVPILRAGLGMADAILELVPQARVWHLGLYRDRDTHLPVTYYNKMPADAGIDVAYVVDPMLATGGSAVEAVGILKKGGIGRIRFLALIAAPEGVQALTAAHPEVPLFVGAVDSHLDAHCYIVPGLGDAGDRQFGTH